MQFHIFFLIKHTAANGYWLNKLLNKPLNKPLNKRRLRRAFGAMIQVGPSASLFLAICEWFQIIPNYFKWFQTLESKLFQAVWNYFERFPKALSDSKRLQSDEQKKWKDQ